MGTISSKGASYPDDKLIGSVEQVVPDMTRDLTKWKLEKTAQGFHKWVRKTPRSGIAPPSVLEQRKKRITKEKEGGPPSVGSSTPLKKVKKKKVGPY